MTPPRCTTIVLASEDHASRPLSGHVVVEADRPGSVDLDVVLTVRAGGPNLSVVEEVARAELRGAPVRAGSTTLPFRLPGQVCGWSHDHAPFHTTWQLEAGAADGAPTARLPVAQSPPPDAPAVVTPRDAPRLDWVETRDLGAVVLLGGAAAVLLAVAAAFTVVWRVPEVALPAVALALLLVAPPPGRSAWPASRASSAPRSSPSVTRRAAPPAPRSRAPSGSIPARPWPRSTWPWWSAGTRCSSPTTPAPRRAAAT